MKFKISFLTVLLLALSASAVSRVGGGKVRSNSSGFEIQVPKSYGKTKEQADGVTALGPNVYVAGQGLVPEYVNISEFYLEFPDLVTYSPEELETRLTANRWEVIPAEAHSCIVSLRFASNQIVVYALTWGNGKGVVMKAPKVGATEDAIKEMLATLTLDPGSCAWK